MNQRISDVKEEALLALSKPRFARFCLSLAADWLTVAAGFAMFALFPSIPGFLAASVVVGIGQHALMILGHEAVHYRVCNSRRWNDWIGALFCFFPVTLTVSTYRDFHFPHHRQPGGPEDPEVPVRVAMGKNWLPPFGLKRGLVLWAKSFLGASLKELVVFTSYLPRGSAKERLGLGLFWVSVIAIAYRFSALPLVGLWFFALSTTYFSKLRIQAWYEHSLEQPDTNRYRMPGIVYRFICPHNIWVHYEHHLYPNIPFYNLEQARAILGEEEKIYSFGEMVEEIHLRAERARSTPEKKAA